MAAPHHQATQPNLSSVRNKHLTATSISRFGATSSRTANPPSSARGSYPTHALPESEKPASFYCSSDSKKKHWRNPDIKTRAVQPKTVPHSTQKPPTASPCLTTRPVPHGNRSYSEIVKNESALLQKVESLSDEVGRLKEVLSSKETCIENFEKNSQSLCQQLTELEQMYENKLQSAVSLQSERYQSLNVQYQALLDHTKIYSSKLEKLNVDLLSLQPFHFSSQQKTNLQALRNKYSKLLSCLQIEAQKMHLFLSTLHQQYISQCPNCQAGRGSQIEVPSVDALISEARLRLARNC